jgi:hypothetical protein
MINTARITSADMDRASGMDDVNEAALYLQNIAGITDGGICGQHLNEDNWAAKPDRRALLSRWIEDESHGNDETE